jgi:hypothetical protein
MTQERITVCDHADKKDCETCLRARLEETWTDFTAKALERARKTLRHDPLPPPPRPLPARVAPAPG